MTDNTPDAPAVALLPCPFCDGEASAEFFSGDGVTIFCDGCHARASTEKTRTEATAAWNTRPTAALPSEDDVVDALRAAKLQLEYLDGRWPTGTTPPTVARIERVLAAMAPEQIADGWRDIASAAKDGTVILAVGADGLVCLAQWGPGWGQGVVTPETGPCWGVSDGSDPITHEGWDTGTGCYLTIEPTVWQPLPSPPTEQEPQ